MWGDGPPMSMAGNSPIATRFSPDYVNIKATPRKFRIFWLPGKPYKYLWWPTQREPPLDINQTDNYGFDTFFVGHFHQDYLQQELRTLKLHQMVTTYQKNKKQIKKKKRKFFFTKKKKKSQKKMISKICKFGQKLTKNIIY